MDQTTTLIYPKRSTVAGGLSIAAGAAMLLGSIGLELAEVSTLGAAVVVGHLFAPVLGGLMFIALGVLLFVPKGTIEWRGGSQSFSFLGGFASAMFTVKRQDVGFVQLFRREIVGEEELSWYSVELAMKDGGFVLLTETTDFGGAVMLGREFASISGLDFHEDQLDTATGGGGRIHESACVRRTTSVSGTMYTWRVGLGGGYYVLIGLLSLVALSLGIALSRGMFTSLAGIIFGPALVLCGAGGSLTLLEKLLASDAVEVSEKSLGHRAAIGRFSWGLRSATRDASLRFRLTQFGARGLSLEAVNGVRTIDLASGISNRSAIKPCQLRQIAAFLASETNAP